MFKLILSKFMIDRIRLEMKGTMSNREARNFELNSD